MHTIDTAAELALAVAEALRDPERIRSAITPTMVPSLCDGLAGTALLHACLAQHEPNHADVAVRHWQVAAQHLAGTRPAGIHTGKGGLAASLIIGTGYLPDPAPHHRAVSRAVEWLSARAEALADHQRERSRRGNPGALWAVYDAINGLSGIGRVLLAAHQAGHHSARRGLDAAVTTLTGILTNSFGNRPGWWLPASDHAPAVGVQPSGAAATGLAHGIAGPLSLLTSTLLAGYTAPGREKALRRATQWLLEWQENTGSWPPLVSGDALDDTRKRRFSPGRRNAWCYGSPGIAVTLRRAGIALHDGALAIAADNAFAALRNTSPSNWDTEGPTLCHGSVGVLQTANSAKEDALAGIAADLTTRFHDRGLEFGFPHIETAKSSDRPGFLTGATGVALALAEYGRLLPEKAGTAWDALLLLS